MRFTAGVDLGGHIPRAVVVLVQIREEMEDGDVPRVERAVVGGPEAVAERGDAKWRSGARGRGARAAAFALSTSAGNSVAVATP